MIRRWLWAAASAVALLAGPATAGLDARFEQQRPSEDARYVARWALETADAEGKPFLVVDKKAARLYVFEGDGRLVAATHVLLGASPGDHSVPGVGERAQTGTLRPDERTTPAGRFETQAGRNVDGEHVIWIDWDAALAIHRVRPGRSWKARNARLEASAPHERRVSLGCIVVPVAFYLDVVEPLLGRKPGVVYVLPETASVRDVFATH